MTSPDGINWTTRTSAANNDFWHVIWASELELLVATSTSGTGNRIMTSPDGINWTTRSTPVDNQWLGITWAPELGLLVAVAQSGTGNRVMTSSDGINWTTRSSAADNLWYDITWAPELGLLVAVAIFRNRKSCNDKSMMVLIGLHVRTPIDNQWMGYNLGS
jgi:hypothetical protein